MVHWLWIILTAGIYLVQNGDGEDSLRFLLVGDLGGLDYPPYSTYFERSVATQMGAFAQATKPHFIIELGDNFYYDGVTDVNDKRFFSTFEDVFATRSLQIPWFIIAGNHDHHGNVSAQIEYSSRSSRWNFPSKYYYKEFTIGSVNRSLGIVFIDTVDLCGNTHDEKGDQPDGIVDELVKQDQWSFIKHALENSRADYLFTAGHYPVYSIGKHGSTKCLVKDLIPYLVKYNANGHFSGHDHNLQNLQVKKENGGNLDYFVSGMANFVDPSDVNKGSVPKGSSKFFSGNYTTKGGFLYAKATANALTFEFIDANGVALYTTSVLPRALRNN